MDDSRNSVKTDLSLLLECVKFQMKCPDLQRQALLTIHSICERREDNVDLLREMGGVMFVYNLSKSTIVHSEVKETALFTLATLAEASVYCKMSLCSEETFVDLSAYLMKEDLPLRMKRVSVYLLSVLVANNKSGQTLAQTTGCLDNLLDLFRTNCPLSTEVVANAEDSSHLCQLWVSVSSALCGCINNPQNGNGQQKCIVVFPFVKIWLEQISLSCKDVLQPLCSFISMTVANNSHVQETFSASGGLETLALALVSLASGTEISLMTCQLSVIISKTVTACITNNPFLASGLAQYGVVPHLFSLLACPYLDCDDRLTILLTVGHCTEDCEEHQSHLVQCGGLPIIISLLAEDASEEVRRTATFILQTCKQATMSLGAVPAVTEEQEETNPLKNMEAFRSSAKELLHRIEQLEKRHSTEVDEEQEDATTTDRLIHPTSTSVSHLPFEKMGKYYCKTSTPNTPLKNEESLCAGTAGPLSESFSWKANLDRAETSGYNAPGMSLEGGRVTQTTVRRVFPEKIRRNLTKEFSCVGEMKGDIEKVPPASLSQLRCAGCILAFEKVTSRTFAHLLSTSPQNCDMHMVLHKATQNYIAQHCILLRKSLDDSTEDHKTQRSGKVSTVASEIGLSPKTVSKRTTHSGNILNPRGISLTPWKQCTRAEAPHKSAGLIPFKRPRLPPDPGQKSGETIEQRISRGEPSCSKDFSPEEVHNLLCGVKDHGPSWSTILGSYSFKPGRTSVDLARKYRRLKEIDTQEQDILEVLTEIVKTTVAVKWKQVEPPVIETSSHHGKTDGRTGTENGLY